MQFSPSSIRFVVLIRKWVLRFFTNSKQKSVRQTQSHGIKSSEKCSILLNPPLFSLLFFSDMGSTLKTFHAIISRVNFKMQVEFHFVVCFVYSLTLLSFACDFHETVYPTDCVPVSRADCEWNVPYKELNSPRDFLSASLSTLLSFLLTNSAKNLPLPPHSLCGTIYESHKQLQQKKANKTPANPFSKTFAHRNWIFFRHILCSVMLTKL